jgi:membrane-associated phospholipid phosphatase
MRNPLLAALVVQAQLFPGPVHAQDTLPPPARDSLPLQATAQPRPQTGFAFRWWHAGIASGLIALTSLVDRPLRDEVQEDRSSGSDDAARLFRHMGQVEVFGTVGVGTILAGVVAGDAPLRRAGERISASLLVAGGTTTIVKLLVGRYRPNSGRGAYRFSPFSNSDASFPSGHATAAFALAASVSDEVRWAPATVGLYGLAALTAWSRLNDDKHWLSDVLAGAAVGVTSAKFINGRWRVFGLRAPRFLLEPDRIGVSLTW